MLSGVVHVVDSLTLGDEVTFDYSSDTVTHCAFSHDSTYLATAVSQCDRTGRDPNRFRVNGGERVIFDGRAFTSVTSKHVNAFVKHKLSLKIQTVPTKICFKVI